MTQGDPVSGKESQPAHFNLDDYLANRGEGAKVEPTAEVPEADTKNLDDQLAQLIYDDHHLDHKLKGFLGPAVTSLVVGQVLVMNLASWSPVMAALMPRMKAIRNGSSRGCAGWSEVCWCVVIVASL